MRWFIGFAALSLIGCNGEEPVFIDADNDGSVAGEDCDDNNPAVNPNEREICNGIDDDCDGETDENLTQTWYLDDDNDGYGDPATAVEVCEPPADHVQNADDCDDSDFDISPAPEAVELCDDIDHNCDGDPYAEAIGGEVWSEDRDSDGFGNNDSQVIACLQPEGYVPFVEDAEDCDDQNANRNPGMVEDCDTAFDDDCDGTGNNNPINSVPAYFDYDEDGFGDPAQSVQVCEPVGQVLVGGELVRTVGNDGDCDDSNFYINPNRDEVCNAGVDDDCDPSTDEDMVGHNRQFFWFDADGDLHGTEASEELLCPVGLNFDEPPAGYVLAGSGEDCAPNDPAISPSADEICNDGIDNNCDGLLNVGAPAAPFYYEDADNDGLGLAGSVGQRSCDPVPDKAANDNDCDDNFYDPIDNSGSVPYQRNTIDDVNCNFIPDAREGGPKCENSRIDGLETWPGRNVQGDSFVYTVSTECRLLGGGNLTIGEGAIVRFAPGAFMEVFADDQGAGIQASGVTFENGDPNGTWGGIRLMRGTTEGFPTEISGTIRGVSGPALRIDGETAYLEDLVIEDSTVGIDGSALTSAGDLYLNNVTMRNIAGDGLRITKTPAAFENNTFRNIGGYPVTLPAVAIPTMGNPGNTFDVATFATPTILIQNGIIENSAVWPDLGMTYRLEAFDVSVGDKNYLVLRDGARLTLNGLTLEFEADTGLITTPGILDAVDTNFVAAETTWDGLFLGNTGVSAKHILNGGTISGTSGAGVTLNSASVDIDDVTFADITGAGIIMRTRDGSPDSTIELDNASFYNITGRGVDVGESGEILSFSNNTFEDVADVPVTVPAGNLGLLDTASQYALGSSLGVIEVRGGTVEEDAILPDLDVVYRVLGSVSVGSPNNPTLTIEDGVSIDFAENAGLNVGTTSPASLAINGTVVDTGDPDPENRYIYGVSFEPLDGVSWGGVNLGAFARNSQVSGLHLDSGGTQVVAGSNGGALWIDGNGAADPEDRVAVEIRDSMVTKSVSAGILADDTRLTVENVVLTDSATVGLELRSGVVAAATELLDVTALGNNDSGVSVDPTLINALQGAAGQENSFAGNGLPIEITGGTLPDDATLTLLDEDYYVSGPVRVEDADDPMLTIDPGVTVFFGEDGALLVGVGDQGSLDVNGTVAEPVKLTSLFEFEYPTGTPSNGSWGGIEVGPDYRLVDLEYAEIAYAGDDSTKGAVYVYPRLDTAPRSVLLDHVDVHNSGAAGVKAGEPNEPVGYSLVMRDSNFDYNDDEGIYSAGGILTFTGNTVSFNQLCGINWAVHNFTSFDLTNTLFSNDLLRGFASDGACVESAYITTPVTLPNIGIPYYVERTTDPVRDGFEIFNDGTPVFRGALTVEDGVEVHTTGPIDTEGGPVSLGTGVELHASYVSAYGGATLDLDPGVEVYSDFVLVGVGSNGRISAVGTAGDPIRFAGFDGAWEGITLGQRCESNIAHGCELDYVIIEDVEGAPALEVQPRGALGPVLVTNTVVRDSDTIGPVVSATGADALESQQSICEDVDGDGVCAYDADADVYTEIVDFCFDGAFFGGSNYFCNNVDSNYGYVGGTCAMAGPVDCSGQPSWAN